MDNRLLVAADLLEENGLNEGAVFLRREPCFLTGSRAYGTPRPGSDVDLVVLISESELAVLKNTLHYKTVRRCTSIKAGHLNLLCTTDLDTYNKWLEVTNKLIALKPVTKEQAIMAFTLALGESAADQDSPPDWDS